MSTVAMLSVTRLNETLLCEDISTLVYNNCIYCFKWQKETIQCQINKISSMYKKSIYDKCHLVLRRTLNEYIILLASTCHIGGQLNQQNRHKVSHTVVYPWQGWIPLPQWHRVRVSVVTIFMVGRVLNWSMVCCWISRVLMCMCVYACMCMQLLE